MEQLSLSLHITIIILFDLERIQCSYICMLYILCVLVQTVAENSLLTVHAMFTHCVRYVYSLCTLCSTGFYDNQIAFVCGLLRRKNIY